MTRRPLPPSPPSVRRCPPPRSSDANAPAGLTTRRLSGLATCVLQAFPGTFPKALTVGHPVRAGFAELPAPAQRINHPGVVRLLVIGGSQGARALNELVPKALALMTDAPEVRHQAGRTLQLAQQCYVKAAVQASIGELISDRQAPYA